ncbi:putative glycosyltransferase EpsH [Pseudomonas sp. AD21]|uniref:polysaccharide pyruvyl transferase family protein n=1 Tax=Pseudomonas sp. AD21 TaxID=396378 RepID=UPI000C852BC6|nr:polysaccharide pyruvyl transferase family protein [Pseudomonas sp. AD21]PMQ14345.1 putative glycosyltransferase EpsH [Pseudomonas sp. AD21]
MTDKPKVLVSGWYGASNIGDELLLGAVAAWVADAGGELTIISLNPLHTAQVYGVAAVDFHNLGEIASVLADCDLFVMGGGGIFQDHHPFNITALYDATALDIAQYARPFYLARQYGVKTLILAHGVGPLMSHDAQEVVRDVFTLADFVSVRDVHSEALLRKIGVTRELLVAADPGWFAASEVVRTSLVSKTDNDTPAEKRKLALIIREWNKDQDWEEKLVSALNSRLPENWSCVWFAFQNSLDETRAGSDKPFLGKLSASLDPRISYEIIDHIAVSDVVNAINECDAVLSMRLHGSILSLALGKPCAFLEYDDKMTQAHNMAHVPEDLRLDLRRPLSAYERIIEKLTDNQVDWVIDAQVLQTLQNSALAHRDVLIRALELVRGGGEKRRRWSSHNLDWMSVWLQELIWQKRTIERASVHAHDLLGYRDFQLHKKDLELNELKQSLQNLQQQMAELDKEVQKHKQQSAEFESLFHKQQQQTAAVTLKARELHDAEHERHHFEQKFLTMQETVVSLQQALGAQTTQLQELESAKQKTGTKMSGSLQNLTRKIQRATYLLQNGGPRALLSALRVRRQMLLSQQMPLPVITPSESMTQVEVDHALFEAAAKLRDEEIVIFASHAFQSLGGHHRPAQLARAALSAGHRVIYITQAQSDRSNSFAAQQCAGLSQLCLSELSVEKLFSQLSENSVVLNFVLDSNVLAYLQFAQNRGLKVFLESTYLLNDPLVVSAPLFAEMASVVSAICVASTQTAAHIATVTNTPTLCIEMAASHTYFDIYRNYQAPHQYQGVSGTKAIVFAPGEESNVDWAYVERIASLNPQITFFLLGAFNHSESFPANIVILPEECLNNANALIAHSDLLLSPFSKSIAGKTGLPQGIYAGAFLNKPIISSQEVNASQLNNFLYLPEAEVLGDTSGRFPAILKNDLFVSQNSWLARLEALVPAVSRHDVSVVILIHNNASIIARCLETLQQHCGAYIKEVIVVDNASSDGGAELVEQQFPEVKLIRNPENGCSSGRNLGAAHATGKYITFFDSDQWFTGASGFAEALSILERHASVGVIGWNAGWFDATRTDLGGMIADYCPNRAMNPQAIRDGYRSDIGFLGTSGFFMHRSVFDAIEGFDTFYDPTCFEDTDLCFQIRALGMEISFRDLSGIRHQPHQTTGADSGSDKYKALFLRNSAYFKGKWKHKPEYFVDYSN